MRTLLVGFAALCATGAMAQAQRELSYMAIISGTCSQLTIEDEDRTADCPATLFNTAYVDNHSSFRIASNDGSVVSFFGYDHAAEGDVANLTVQRLLFTPAVAEDPDADLAELTRRAMASTKDVEAVGECEYTNPALRDNYIRCEALAEGKTYSFTFHASDFEVVDLGGRIR